jgi:hypothetical protein
MAFDDLVQSDSAVLMDLFGIPALLSDGVHDPKDIRVVFDQTSIDSMGVLSDQPQVNILTSDLDDRQTKNVVLTIKAVNYSIQKPLPDGYGLTLATLKRL